MTDGTNTKTQNNERFNALDGLKGILALIVAFFWHYQHFAPEGRPFYSVLRTFYDIGGYAVEGFFVISGFCMLLSYESRILSGKVSFKSYSLKRIRRLYPQMIISTLVVAALQALYMMKTGIIFVFPVEHYDVYHFVLNILGLQNGLITTDFSFNAPTWFISVLLVMYLLFYLVVKLCGALKFKPVVRTLVYGLFAVIGGILVYKNLMTPVINIHIGRGILCFFIGLILGFFHKADFSIKKEIIGYVALAIFAITFVVFWFKGYDVFFNRNLFMAIIWAPVIVLMVLYVPFIQKFLSLKVFKFLGSISMYVFIWHFPVQIVIDLIRVSFGLPNHYSYWWVWILYILAVLAFAYFVKLLSEGFRRKFFAKV